jgi:predicted nucleotidyltransferase
MVPACGHGFSCSLTAAYPLGMASAKQSSDPLATAALTDRERRVLGRLLRSLREELGGDLLAVWLYGSRARGEANLEETNPDRKSDIDLMVLVDPSRGWTSLSGEVVSFVNEAADAEGESPVWYSVLVWDSERLRDRREIRSFFIQEVDRDKIVLHGSALE